MDDIRHRLLSIDPGFNFGVAVIEVDFESNTCHVLHAHTFDILKIAKSVHSELINTHGERIAKLKAIETIVSGMMIAWDVSGVVSESPYLGRFANSFQSLVECLCYIQNGIFVNTSEFPLALLDPTTVKRSVGAPKSKDKDAVKQAVRKLNWVTYAVPGLLDDLDEHGVDAIAVGLARFIQLRGDSHESK